MTTKAPKPRRTAGMLLHPTSLPGPHGIGDLGRSARRFIDWLAQAGLSVWQVLPLNPTSNNSPYMCWSAFAGNPMLIDLANLVEHGLLAPSDLEGAPPAAPHVDFDAVTAFKTPLLEQAADRLVASPNHALAPAFAAFQKSETWAKEASLFWALKRAHAMKPFWEWPLGLRDREPAALAEAERTHERAIMRTLAMLFLFEHQWADLHVYAKSRGVSILGDLPIYVDRDSADVWSNQRQFDLAEGAVPLEVSGVPPDYFSEKGQLWGNPLYAWDVMANDDFAWWRARLRRVLTHTDICRIDHFRAFAAYWAVPFGAPDARSGRWRKGPGLAFFEAIKKHEGTLPLVAEDLGIIDDEVNAVRKGAGLPGMRVLQFAFGSGPENTHLPHNHEADCVVYPATHDNDTTNGWWQSAPSATRVHAGLYIGILVERAHRGEVAWDFVRAAFASVANMAIVSAQDVLGLGTEARMNDPSTSKDNWRFRLAGDPFTADLAKKVRELAALFGRA
ncbi:MAG: 4-alpha-glucanotransferase [Polyangiaceae bacterium]|nr:4-alpha-glucanotransferase [Polyangiaceae bacterium]